METRTLNRNKPKIRLQMGDGYRFVKDTVDSNNLNTVCEEARCPNIYECWGRGTATIMILGEVCTRACGFCSVKTGKPTWNDPMEPYRTAMAVKRMQLKHVVITSVDRDDLKDDFGSDIWAETIRQIHTHVQGCTVEVLTPDFQGYAPSLLKVFNAGPEIFSHNVECVERISRQVRAQANWKRSLTVLKQSADFEVIETMKEIADLGVSIFTIGQYLQPSRNHLPVERYVDDDEFLEYKRIGLDLGFRVVESGALVRSSYHADEQAKLASPAWETHE